MLGWLRKYGVKAWFLVLAAAFLTEPLWWPNEPTVQKIWLPAVGVIILAIVLGFHRRGSGRSAK